VRLSGNKVDATRREVGGIQVSHREGGGPDPRSIPIDVVSLVPKKTWAVCKVEHVISMNVIDATNRLD
jgi:hypothetical protein